MVRILIAHHLVIDSGLAKVAHEINIRTTVGKHLHLFENHITKRGAFEMKVGKLFFDHVDVPLVEHPLDVTVQLTTLVVVADEARNVVIARAVIVVAENVMRNGLE